MFAALEMTLRSRDKQAFYSHTTDNRRDESSLYREENGYTILPGPKMTTSLRTGQIAYYNFMKQIMIL